MLTNSEASIHTMKAIAVLLMFVGVILVIQGYYTQTQTCPTPETRVLMVPRSVFEEQTNPEATLAAQFKSMFDDASGWPKRG